MKQEKFYQLLSDIPAAPDLYPEIESEILKKSSNSMFRYIWSIAATFILAIGIIQYSNNHSQQSFNNLLSISKEPLTEDVTDELQIISDLLDGVSIDEDIELYALVEYDDF